MLSKSKICEVVNQLLIDKIAVTEKAMKDAQDAANNETKSSAGDKYETGRAMSQNEKDINARHLADLLKMKKAMGMIKKDKVSTTAELGSLVEADEQFYFISVGLGALEIEGNNLMAISAISPIGQSMIGKKEGDVLDWRGQKIQIRSVS